jgi:GT2 family glycosyltransferase
MAAEPTTLSIVIPVRDDARRLARCLMSLRACDYPSDRIELVVADNGSIDDSADVARRAGAHVLSLPGLRVSQMRNVAAQQSHGAVVAFVDADHAVDPGWMQGAIDALSQPRVGMAGALYDTPPEGTWVQRAFDAMRGRTTGFADTDWLASGNMALTRAAFDAAGGFDASLETCEDVDLCRKVRAKGYRVVTTPRMKSYHFGDPATLRALCYSELWRGRDNLVASFRRPIAVRGLPSALIPVFELALMALALAGLLTAPRGLILTIAAAAVVFALAALRAFKMLRAGRHLRASDPVDIGRGLIVALVYDSARALALVVRAGHRHRRVGDPAETGPTETQPSHEQTDSRAGTTERRPLRRRPG